MLSFDNKLALISHLATFRVANATIGFVPTMGALHQGHLSLISKSLQNNTITVVSIFVNPTQFNNPDDLKKYPRTLEHDLQKIGSLSDKIIVYTPTIKDIYTGNAVAKSYAFDGLDKQMEGKFRSGHFDGVGTVVQKLFEIVKPTTAYFGEKDFQQLQIVKKLVQKQNLNVTVVACEISREKNGLAMSSRNERLAAFERQEAQLIYKTLLDAKKLFETKSAKITTAFVQKTFNSQKIFTLEYFEIADENTLISTKYKSKTKKNRAFIAVFAGPIRLIDTIALY